MSFRERGQQAGRAEAAGLREHGQGETVVGDEMAERESLGRCAVELEPAGVEGPHHGDRRLSARQDEKGRLRLGEDDANERCQPLCHLYTTLKGCVTARHEGWA